MIRVLTMIAVAGFILSVATFAAAVAIGGPDAIARGGWKLASGHWGDGDWERGDRHGRRHRDDWASADQGPQVTRTLEWSGAESLDIELRADVTYIQAPGPGSVVITGPQRAVERVVVSGEKLRYRQGHAGGAPRLTIVVRAPGVRAFDISGNSHLEIEGYRQDSLSLDVSGSADLVARGETGDIALDISGSGDVDLGGLKARGADVDISGSADAIIAPTDWAQLEVSGMGDVRLLTNPPRLEAEVSGSGRVRQGEANPPPTPSPPASPAAKGQKL